jgi:hypothetical protein
MLLPNSQMCYSSVMYDLFCYCLVHVKTVCRFCVQVRVVMCTIVIWEICITPNGASIGCVGASVRIVPDSTMRWGWGRGTAIDIAFIVSIGSGNPCNF